VESSTKCARQHPICSNNVAILLTKESTYFKRKKLFTSSRETKPFDISSSL
jgi:hypothetical protein